MKRKILGIIIILALVIVAAGCKGGSEEKAMAATARKYVELLTTKQIDEAKKLVTGTAAIELEQFGKALAKDPSEVKIVKFDGHLVYLNRDKTRGIYEVNYEKSVAVQDLGRATMSYVGRFGLVKLDGAWKIYSLRWRNADL